MPALPNDTSILQARDRYLELGLCPIPLWGIHQDGSCECPQKDCRSPGKHPRLRDWQKKSALEIMTDPAWSRPLCGVGMRMGLQPGGLFLVSIDDDGELVPLLLKLGELPTTLMARTGRGKHLFFRLPAGASLNNTQHVAGHSVDVRAAGGFVVAAPTLHANGRRYQWSQAEWEEPAELPQGWLARLQAPPPAAVHAEATEQRDSRQEAPNVLERARKYLATMDPAISGSGGHQTTWRVAQALVRGFDLPRGQALELMRDWNVACQPPWSEHELMHKLESAEQRSKLPRGFLRDQTAALARVPASQWPAEEKPEERRLHASVPIPQATEKTDEEEDATDWPTDWLPEPIAAWVEAVSETYAVPKAMPIAAACCAMAVMLQGKAFVRIKPGWEEPLSLFWLVFAPSSAMKSIVMKLAAQPIRDLQTQLEEEIKPIRQKALFKKQTLQAQHARMRASVKANKYHVAAEGKTGYREHLEQLRELEFQLQNHDVPQAPRWLVDDINPPLLIKMMGRNLEAEGLARMAVLDAEGTFLAKVLGQDTRHIDLPSLLKSYSGEAIDRVRSSRTTDDAVCDHLPHSHMTICIMAQPHVLDQLRAAPALAQQGFMGRCQTTKLPSRLRSPAWDAPPVPNSVQEAYSACIQALHAIPVGTVVDLTGSHELEKLYDTTCIAAEAEQEAVAFNRRSVGRIARVMACQLLAERTGKLANWQPSLAVYGGGGDAASHARYEKKISSLISLLYFRTLSSAQANEPATGSISTLTHRAHTWMSRTVCQLNGIFTFRELRRALKLAPETAESVITSLIESGSVEEASRTTNRNKTVTLSYRMLQMPTGKSQ